MIDTSQSSIVYAIVMVMGVVWFYLLNEEIRDRMKDDD
jgi:hypothetical protein